VAVHGLHGNFFQGIPPQTGGRFARQLAKGLLVLLTGCLGVSRAAPSIEITNAPPFGSTNDVGGVVLNANPDAYRVALFIYVPSAGWWSKPYCDPQLTAIQPDGSWTVDMTTGGADAYATKITAQLVSTNYAEPCVLGLAELPTNVTARAVASTTVIRADTTIRWVRFSGYDWWVKSSPGLLGPGPNYFSDCTNNVWLDAQGRLHLRITNRSNEWQCAEVVTARTFGFGNYRFELASSVNDLNLNAVLGLFTWSDDPTYTHREIDIECSRWSNPYDTNNAQYVVQPWDTPGHLVRYAVPAGQTDSTHVFTWETNRVSYLSQRGGFSPTPLPTNIISSWTFALDVPRTGDENVRINLWLYNGTPPNNNQEVEFVIKSFEFVPLGRPLPAQLTNISRYPAGPVHLGIECLADWKYQVQASANLLDWENLATLLATNSLMDFFDTNSPAPDRRFYRTLTLP
jgi:hypothetical protein